jgi:hypothetical protein
METPTATHQKKLCFYVEADPDPIAALEQALAIIRRLGMELRNLRTHADSKGLAVFMCVSAEDENLITICRKRLQNVIGIFAVHESVASIQAVSRRPLSRSAVRSKPNDWIGSGFKKIS